MVVLELGLKEFGFVRPCQGVDVPARREREKEGTVSSESHKRERERVGSKSPEVVRGAGIDDVVGHHDGPLGDKPGLLHRDQIG